GLLETNNQLERFTKNKKSKKLTYSIIGLLLIIGCITLFKTYAFYEEKKSFNILKGKIPDFDYDIKMLSVVIDDKKSDIIPERGLYKANVDCTKGTIGKWDYNNWNLILENVNNESKCNLTFTSGLSEETYNKYLESGIALHRNTYRGKDISEYYKDGSLYTRINNGSFEDIYIGDYINANGISWLIADIDNYMRIGVSNPITKHHVTLISSGAIKSAKMNDENNTNGGYANSKMYKEILPEILEKNVFPTFGEHVLTLSNAITNSINSEATSNTTGNIYLGSANSFTWANRQIDLMNEVNVFGSNFSTNTFYDVGVDTMQYAIFKLNPSIMRGTPKVNYSYWLRNIVSKTHFSFINSNGAIEIGNASSEKPVRPRIIIG
ncbi:MAG: hypothetical protein HFJ02_06455, partial [Bacilli bacterium]|nr:hypothetical protein [Bacilli bacterium]